MMVVCFSKLHSKYQLKLQNESEKSTKNKTTQYTLVARGPELANLGGNDYFIIREYFI